MDAIASDDLGLDLSFVQLTDADLAKASPAVQPAAGAAAKDDAASTITVNTKAPAPAPAPAPQFPPPKTDKPRPHVCTTCQRSFARLEHLKRHERSHTKEKPFECDQCTRCFARRDLLLRHQQKLHQSTTPAARPRNRRESTTGVAPSRARKSSMASTSGSGSVAASLAGLNRASSGLHASHAASNTMRPRANTISHVDASAMNMVSPTAASMARGGIPPGMHSRHPSLAGLPMHGMEHAPLQPPAFVGMASAMGQRGVGQGLPKLETNSVGGLDFAGSLHPASAHPVFSPDFDFDSPSFGGASAGTTINPNALHYSDSPQSFALDPTSTFGLAPGYNELPGARDSLSWLTGFENQLSLGSAIDESAVDGSSPSAMSTGSQSGISDVMLDGSIHLNGHAVTMAPPTAASSGHALPAVLSPWQPNSIMTSHQALHGSFAMDLGPTSFSDLLSGLPLSPGIPPHTLALPNAQTPMSTAGGGGGGGGGGVSAAGTSDTYFSTPPPSLSAVSPSMLSSMNHGTFGPSTGLNGGTAPETPNSLNGSNSSVSNNGQHHQIPSSPSSPVSTLTDATRTAIVNALNSATSQTSPFGIRKYSFTAPTSASGLLFNPEQAVPSTADLQKYVSAYLRYFHPHFPFLHIGTMSFETPAAPSATPAGAPPSMFRSSGASSSSSSGIGASGCLILSMAAIGALFEFEQDQSRMLFAMAKRMIQLYLDERRKANVRKADFRRAPLGDSKAQQQNADSSSDTPVWLVQAMLLNVVYGHNGSDKRAGEIASTHCAALVSLAQGAELLQPTRVEPWSGDLDMSMADDTDAGNIWDFDESKASAKAARDEALWRRWKAMEERKRTLYAIFTLSSFLVSSYNHTPALTNSEIMLDLPCDEEFFAAPSCAEFMARGGVAAANRNRMTFHEALGNLLRASERQARHGSDEPGAGPANNAHGAERGPSTFGCFVLINALHNYIWETRQRHHNKVWTNEETEKMHRHIEPALEAWHRAWKNNLPHAADTSNPLGIGGLAADAIPLLDLAHVRLYVNLARTKEKFWQRNWDGLAEELSFGGEIVQHAEHSPAVGAEPAVLLDLLSDFSGNAPSLYVDPHMTQLSASPDLGAAKYGAVTQPAGQQQTNRATTTRREKHLRKAAQFAVDALSMGDKTGFTLADFGNRELPLQSALCVFDCAQVLAEWAETLQDRVGRYLGILDQNVDLNQVPAIMLIDEEDGRLLGKIRDVLNAVETNMSLDRVNGTASPATSVSSRVALRMQMEARAGYGAKILGIAAYTLGKACVWPVTHLMAECLENHANHMRARAERSLVACD